MAGCQLLISRDLRIPARLDASGTAQWSSWEDLLEAFATVGDLGWLRA
jgi:hypothetical protein